MWERTKAALAGVLACALLGCVGAGSPVPPSGSTATIADTSATDPTVIGNQTSDTAATRFPAATEYSNAVLTSTIIEAPNGTFGYEVFSDGKLFLHQTNLPGQPGNDGCKTKADAEKLVAFVIEKIKQGQMPPTIETEDLKTLGIIH